MKAILSHWNSSPINIQGTSCVMNASAIQNSEDLLRPFPAIRIMYDPKQRSQQLSES